MKVSYRTTSYITISPFIEAIRLPSTLSTTNIDTLLEYIIAFLYIGFVDYTTNNYITKPDLIYY